MSVTNSPGTSPAGKRLWDAGIAYQRRQAEPIAVAEPVEEKSRRYRKAVLRQSQRDWLWVQTTPDPVKPPPSDSIVADAVLISGLPRSILKSSVRQAAAVLGRHYAMQRMRDELGLSTTQIGRILGGRDHTTVLNALSVKNRLRVKYWLAKLEGER